MNIYGLNALELLMKDTNFIVPIYQRRYSWQEPECLKLFNSIVAQTNETETSHFLGSCCIHKTEEGFILVNGQQRIASLMLYLLALRDISRDSELQNQINAILLKDGRSKLILKQEDAPTYERLLYNANDIFVQEAQSQYDSNSLISKNYELFYDHVFDYITKRKTTALANLVKVLSRIEFAVIELGNENPQFVFEELNTTYVGLTELDKIRNYVLMPLSQRDQEEVYEQYWKPLEEKVGENLEEFIASYLVIQNQSALTECGTAISSKTLYSAVRELVKPGETVNFLKELYAYTVYYDDLYSSEGVLNVIFNILQSKSAMTICLYLLKKQKELQADLSDAFALYLSYLFRLKVCERTNSKNTFAGEVIRRTSFAKDSLDFQEQFRSALADASGIDKFPNNKEFKTALMNNDIYLLLGSAGTKYLLSEIETYMLLSQNEDLLSENTTIEHIMPQTLTQEWEVDLQRDRLCHSQYLHTLGNLALTTRNSELSNKAFSEKRKIYANEPFFFTKDLASYHSWGISEIRRRAENLAGFALNIWQDINNDNPLFMENAFTIQDDPNLFVGRRPRKASLLGEEKKIKTWSDLLYFVCSMLYELDSVTFLRFMAKPENKLIYRFKPIVNHRKIADGIYIKTSGGTVRALSDLKLLIEYYDRKSDMTISDKFWFTI